jgi:endonuclease-8
VPEGDTVHRTAATLHRWLAGRQLTAARARSPGIPVDRLVGAFVTAVEPQGKHLLVRLSTGDVLHSHLGMTGAWHVYPAGERWRRPDRQAGVVLEAGDRVAVCFNAPVIEVLAGRDEGVHPWLSRLGPDVLGGQVDLADVRRRARLRHRSGAAQTAAELLLDQQVASGIGNVYRCESLFLCGVHPWSSTGELDDALLDRLITTAADLMRSNATNGRTGGRRFDAGRGRTWVYRRAGRPCRKCGTLVRSQRLGSQARTVYWCPACQAAPAPSPAGEGDARR